MWRLSSQSATHCCSALASEANMAATVGFVSVAQWLWQSGWLLAEAAEVTDTVVVTVWLAVGWSCSGDWHSDCSLVSYWLKLLGWLTQWLWQSGDSLVGYWLKLLSWLTVVVPVWLAIGWSCSGVWHSDCDSLVGYWLKLLRCLTQWLWQSGWLLAEAAQVTDTVTVTVWLAIGWSCSGVWHSDCDSLVGYWLKLLRCLTQWLWQSGWLLAEAAQVTDTVVVTVWLAVGWSCSGDWHRDILEASVHVSGWLWSGGKKNKKSIWLVVFEIQLLVMLNCSGILYGLTRLMYDITFNLNDCFFFGAIISATDPGQSLTCLRFFVFRFLSFILPLHLFCIQ